MPPPLDQSSGLSFPTTRWTIVLQASRNGNGQAVDEAEVGAALESLCSDYRGPVVAFTLACGVPAADAEDIVQDFFARFIGRDGFGKADQAKGRLRTYLLAALKNTIRNYFRHKRAGKRGGGDEPVQLGEAEESSGGVSQANAEPVNAYDRVWAENLMLRALDDVRNGRSLRKMPGLFDSMVPLLDGTGDDPAERMMICERHELTADELSNRLHRFRRRLGRELRALVSATVETEQEVEEELRYLARVLAE